MRLKRVRIFGFKTFADRTEFNLDGSLVAVVGSNGCGKSNLVDAILWGLGEGSAKQVRAGSGIDVIFNGSAKRKPIGFAEVTLFFDNEDRILPIDSEEVVVSRRLTRSGDSEYKINGANCRQRDVYELFADSGLGRDGYAIVGQRQIDSALSASAEERRNWVDEAAGVQRYRARKNEAERRLSAARTHLERTGDILRELREQREPLMEEAEVARRYKSLQSSLRELESGQLMVEVATSIKESEQHAERIAELVRLTSGENQRIDEFELQISATGEKISTLELEMDAVRSAQQGHLTGIERADADMRLAQQRLEGLDESEADLGHQAEIHQQRIAEAEADVKLATEESGKEQAALEEALQMGQTSGEEAKKSAAALQEIEKRLHQARDHETRRQRQIAALEHRKDRSKQISRELKGIEAGEADLAGAIAEAETAETEAENAWQEKLTAVRGLKDDSKRFAEEIEAHSKLQRQSLSEIASLEGRIRGLEATLEAHEGLSQGPRAVLEAVKAGKLSGRFAPVGESVKADPEFALAIETALGGAVNDLIVDSEGDAKAAIEFLKQNRLGRATFQPLPLMRVPERSGELLDISRQPGVVGIAADLAKVAQRDYPVIASLLGRVVVTENLDVALRIAKGRNRAFSRIVTLEGEVVNSGGAVTGGVSSKSSYGMVQRRADIDKLQKQLAERQKQQATSDAKVQEMAVARLKIREEIEVLQTEATGLEAALREARDFAKTLRDERVAAERSRSRLEAELAELAKTEDVLEEIDIAAIEAERNELLHGFAKLSADKDSAEARLIEVRQRHEQARHRLESAERRLKIALETEQSRERKLMALGPERERLAKLIEEKHAQREHAEALLKAGEEKLRELQEAKVGLLEQSLLITEEAKATRENMTALTEATHNAELNRARSENRRTAAAARLLEEYGLDEDDALEAYPTLELPEDAPAIVSRLRREMKAMGDVNVGAIEAFDRLTDRLTELEVQYNDIVDGIAEVEKTIGELDQLTKNKFTATFTAVRTAFANVFRRLFRGGEGSLELTDPESILDSGIELVVTLPGKKRQPLNLLSGGERSLCAVAFLFSLLEVKSSPLVILDEVDAPLDGSNVERFAEILEDFSRSMQFLVITHNPTTIAAAEVWLGVTMGEPGCSTLVPYHGKRGEDPRKSILLA